MRFLCSLCKATLYAKDGLKWAFRYERAFKQECVLLGMAFLVSLGIARYPQDVICLLTPLVIALALELVNTALEQLVNFLAPEDQRTPLFKVVKDCAAAAVCLMLCWAALTWIIYCIELVF